MEFCELLVLAELFFVELESFAAHFEEVEDTHLVDEFGGVVGIEENVFSQFAPLQVLSHQLALAAVLVIVVVFVDVLVPVLLFWYFGVVLEGAVVEGDGEVYLFVEQIVDPFAVVVDDIEVVVLGCFFGVDHVEVLHLGEDGLQLLIFFLQAFDLLVVLDLHYLAHSVFEAVDAVLHQEQFVLDDGLLVEQLGDLAEVLGL